MTVFSRIKLSNNLIVIPMRITYAHKIATFKPINCKVYNNIQLISLNIIELYRF